MTLRSILFQACFFLAFGTNSALSASYCVYYCSVFLSEQAKALYKSGIYLLHQQVAGLVSLAMENNYVAFGSFIT